MGCDAINLVMHHTAADDSLWFPGGHGDIEISLALGASLPLHKLGPTVADCRASAEPSHRSSTKRSAASAAPVLGHGDVSRRSRSFPPVNAPRTAAGRAAVAHATVASGPAPEPAPEPSSVRAPVRAPVRVASSSIEGFLDGLDPSWGRRFSDALRRTGFKDSSYLKYATGAVLMELTRNLKAAEAHSSDVRRICAAIEDACQGVDRQSLSTSTCAVSPQQSTGHLARPSGGTCVAPAVSSRLYSSRLYSNSGDAGVGGSYGGGPASGRALCKFRCGNPVAPGRTAKGNFFDTCCRQCAVSHGVAGHDRGCPGFCCKRSGGGQQAHGSIGGIGGFGNPDATARSRPYGLW